MTSQHDRLQFSLMVLGYNRVTLQVSYVPQQCWNERNLVEELVGRRALWPLLGLWR